MATNFSPSFATPRVPAKPTAVKRIHKDVTSFPSGFATSAVYRSDKQRTLELRSARRVADGLKGRR